MPFPTVVGVILHQLKYSRQSLKDMSTMRNVSFYGYFSFMVIPGCFKLIIDAS